MSGLIKDFENVSSRLSAVDDSVCDGRYIGMKEAAEDAIEHLVTAMFPSYFGRMQGRFAAQEKRTLELMKAFDALMVALKYVCLNTDFAELQASKLIESLPEIYEVLKTDIRAAYEGDPAAVSESEVILSYPAFTAISVYRIAHKLYEMRVPIIPRMMTEYAHARTGIDIHPGATIGSYFFIDHGTGVVIGETTTIGEHVKLYQHVTLGAKSFATAEDGTLVKGIKRHPDIGNNVVIYSGATILGGNTVVGDNCVVGGNVWLTHSLEPDTIITTRSGEEKADVRKMQI